MQHLQPHPPPSDKVPTKKLSSRHTESACNGIKHRAAQGLLLPCLTLAHWTNSDGQMIYHERSQAATTKSKLNHIVAQVLLLFPPQGTLHANPTQHSTRYRHAIQHDFRHAIVNRSCFVARCQVTEELRHSSSAGPLVRMCTLITPISHGQHGRRGRRSRMSQRCGRWSAAHFFVAHDATQLFEFKKYNNVVSMHDEHLASRRITHASPFAA